MGLGIGSRVIYKHTDKPDEAGTVTDVNKSTGEMYVEWDDDIDNDWYYEYDLIAI